MKITGYRFKKTKAGLKVEALSKGTTGGRVVLGAVVIPPENLGGEKGKAARAEAISYLDEAVRAASVS